MGGTQQHHLEGLHPAQVPGQQEHRRPPQDGPQVEVGNPPQGKPGEQALDQHKAVDGIQGLPPVDQGDGNGEHPQQVDVGQHLHNLLGGKHQPGQHAEDRHLLDRQSHMDSAFSA